jgi:hypothetical protein
MSCCTRSCLGARRQLTPRCAPQVLIIPGLDATPEFVAALCGMQRLRHLDLNMVSSLNDDDLASIAHISTLEVGARCHTHTHTHTHTHVRACTHTLIVSRRDVRRAQVVNIIDASTISFAGVSELVTHADALRHLGIDAYENVIDMLLEIRVRGVFAA